MDCNSGSIAASNIERIKILCAIIFFVACLLFYFTNGFGQLEKTKTRLDDYDWMEIKNISEKICHAQTYEEGKEIAKKYNLLCEDGTIDPFNTKLVTLKDGTQVEVAVIGILHDMKADGSGRAGLTLCITSPIGKHSMEASDKANTGWPNSQMREWLTTDILPKQLPSVLLPVITEVGKNVLYINEESGQYFVETTEDKIWLLSITELFGNAWHVQSSNSTKITQTETAEFQYQLFAENQNSISSILDRHGYQSSQRDCSWAAWSRTSRFVIDEYYVFSDAGEISIASSENELEVFIAFCI